ncbi:hypothetical protein TrCOL_g4345 [Triparma columacea]|uniref:Uncharacterized protein n=1 Tax=Triparma columacea TaxID=722753 RepID=A0A9W7L915_9STRA|nr:hypothetical protein TrCOL_g4345 [Triparma columacea]
MSSEHGITNDPEMEKLGANEAATHASSWWSKISKAAKSDGRCLDCTWDDRDDLDLLPDEMEVKPEPDTCRDTLKITVTHSSKSDRQMYGRFRSNFSVDSVAVVGGIIPGAFQLNSPKWRSILVACEGLIKDHSRMTLLRTSAWGEFWMTVAAACDGLVIVPRAQWQFVEIARVKEGYYGRGFRRMLEVFELGVYRERIDKCSDAMSAGGKEVWLEGCAIVAEMGREYPLPYARVLKSTGVGKALRKFLKVGAAKFGPDSQVTSVLERWRHGVELGRIARGVGPGSEAARYAWSTVKAASSAGSGVNGRPSEGLGGGDADAATCDISGASPEDAAGTFHEQGVVYHPDPVLTVGEVEGLRKMASKAFDDLMSEQLTPRGLTLEDEFDFNEVRHRPGNRLDNRYKVDVGVVTGNAKIMDYVKRVFGASDAGTVEVLYAGVVHAWGREEGKEPDVQVWHRDGPTLLGGGEKGRGHITHCLNLFIPLVDVGKENGATEFVPTTHNDPSFHSLTPSVIKHAEVDQLSLPDLAIKPSLSAGGFLMFDIRTLHRGGANYTREGRDVVYVTFAWNWWRDIHMFDSRSLIESEGEGLWRDFVNQVGGGEGGVKTEFGEEVGHPHFTRKWRTMLVEGWREGGEGRRMARVNVEGCRNFLRMVRSKGRARGVVTKKEEKDFTDLTEDYTDVRVLYGCLNDILKEVMMELGFEGDKIGVGVTTMIACIKGEGGDRGRGIEENFTNWYHGGMVGEGEEGGWGRRARLIKSVRQTNASVSDKTLLLVFSSLGSGLVRPEWGGTLGAVGAFEPESTFDVVHVMDPGYSWWNTGAGTGWDMGEWYEGEVREIIEGGGYGKVAMLGDSMGGAGALRFSGLADFTLAFTPQVDLRGYKAVKREDFGEERKVLFKEKLVAVVGGGEGDVEIHYGEDCVEDVRQIGCIEGEVKREGVRFVKHPYDGHELSIELRKRGELKDVVGRWIRKVQGIQSEEEILEEKMAKMPILEVGTKVGVYYDRYHIGEVVEVNRKDRKILVKYKEKGDEYWEDYPSKVEDDIRVIEEEDYWKVGFRLLKEVEGEVEVEVEGEDVVQS